jgi:predicted DNA-binding transcriptional regulator YafY
MRRADRLFQIVQHLRGRRLTTAARLAGWLEVSERTIYRDIRDLSISGVPIEGEAGMGYRLGTGFDLPPIMFTVNEVENFRLDRIRGLDVLTETFDEAPGRSLEDFVSSLTR